ncbi:SprT-like family protein [Soonwooa buanensis]|uniref:SprT-like family protein n=1 Tax=Soonwooa buanensis TaxID=619805 RepID=A0A1T5FXS9_9FLAO|nr:SprT-like domain-containing protein [Soonwooa buanensis]SKC00864.1 SprT-like family protein [Soonwooa buanensis]
MSIETLKSYLPENALSFLKIWFADYPIHIKITRNRNSKLGDYRKMPDQSHQITINSTLEPDLFFFVLTHELAHLIAFEKFGRRISAHGNEWKTTFAQMILESLDIYPQDLQLILKRFSKSPKANFMSSSDLVRYFHFDQLKDDEVFMESLQIGDRFMYREDAYKVEEKRKKLYLCINSTNAKKYLFKPLAKVQKV